MWSDDDTNCTCAGVGLVRSEVAAAGLAAHTLVVYTSDNGPPFPGARTNLYEGGVRVPLLLASPRRAARRNQVTTHLLIQNNSPTMIVPV